MVSTNPPRRGAPLGALRCGRWWVVVGPMKISHNLIKSFSGICHDIPYHKIPSYNIISYNININNINILSHIYIPQYQYYIPYVISHKKSHHFPIIFPWSHHFSRRPIRPTQGPNEAQLRAARFTMSQHDSCLVGRWVDGARQLWWEDAAWWWYVSGYFIG